jgi:hypothetical protein
MWQTFDLVWKNRRKISHITVLFNGEFLDYLKVLYSTLLHHLPLQIQLCRRMLGLNQRLCDFIQINNGVICLLFCTCHSTISHLFVSKIVGGGGYFVVAPPNRNVLFTRDDLCVLLFDFLWAMCALLPRGTHSGRKLYGGIPNTVKNARKPNRVFGNFCKIISFRETEQPFPRKWVYNVILYFVQYIIKHLGSRTKCMEEQLNN